jgi:hypothetical protein
VEIVETPKTFRQPFVLAALGLIFFVAGLAFSGAGVYHLVTGLPMTMSDCKGCSGSHIATRSELWSITLFPCIHTLVGLTLILYRQNATVKVDEERIVKRNILGQVVFDAYWSELYRAGFRLQQSSSKKQSSVYELFFAAQRRWGFTRATPNVRP